MFVKPTQLAVAFAAALTASSAFAFGAVPLTLEEAQKVAEADRTDSITLGANYTQINGDGQSAAKAWNGADNRKGGVNAALTLTGGTAAEGWAVEGDRLGTPIPELTAGYEKAGVWSVNGGYQRFRHVSADNMLIGAATDGTTLEQVRDVYRLDGRVLPNTRTDLRAAWQLDHRKGTNAIFAANKGNSETVYDLRDNHNQVTLSADYTGDGYTAGVEYYLSKYDNSRPAAVRIVDGKFWGNSLDPSNTLHQLTLDGSWQLGAATTLAVTAGYAWNTLDEDTQVFGYDQMRAAGYDADVKIPSFAVTLRSAPMANLTVGADYSYRRHNASVTPDGEDKYFPHDQSYTENKLKANAVYNFGHGYSAKAYGKFERRDNAMVVDHTQNIIGGLELRRRMSSALSGSVGYEYGHRSAHDWLAWGSKFGGVWGERWLPNPNTLASDEFYIWTPWSHAGYDQHSLKANLVTNPMDTVTVSLLGNLYKRDYKRDGIDYSAGSFERSSYAAFDGVHDADGVSLGLDADWQVSRAVSLFGFYNYDLQKTGSKVDNKAARIYRMTVRSDAHTFGIGAGVHPEQAPWRFDVKYVYGYSKDHTDYTSFTTSPGEVFSDRTKSHFVQADLSWKLSPQWLLNGTAQFGRLSSNDRTHNAYTAGDMDTGRTVSPNSTAAAFWIGATYYLK